MVVRRVGPRSDSDEVTSLSVHAQLLDIARNFTALAQQADEIERIGRLLLARLEHGGKVLFCGNGGSAADAQHLAAELTGRYRRDRRPLAALALTTDTSALTAIGNDYGFEAIFARQVEALGRRGDALVAISTSGDSRNVVAAADTARRLGLVVVGLTGASGGELAGHVDHCIKVPASAAERVQELHIAVGHIICGLVEEAMTR
jgi:D-sedoheptulose 7-phosphate isomerase